MTGFLDHAITVRDLIMVACFGAAMAILSLSVIAAFVYGRKPPQR